MRLALILLLAFGASPGAIAQVMSAPLRGAEIVSEAAQLDTKREGSARFFDPQDGQFDLSYFLEDPRGFLPIPIVVTEPAVGYGGGAAGMFLRPRREAGDEGWARPDISAVGAFGTQNGTWGAFAGDASRWLDGRLRTLVGVGTGQFNLDFYGLGTSQSSIDQGVRYALQFTGVIAQANWQLAPKSPWAAGLRYVYADVDPRPRQDANLQSLADQVRVKISAPTVLVEFDTRDNIFTPTRGIYAESSWLASREALGSSDNFERFQQVLIGWHPLPHEVTLGARGNYAWSSDGTPFFLRPFVQLRGVPAMRYQGDQAASVELEARWQFFGRWSVVAFGGAGTIRTDRKTFVATQNVGSGGFGFRYELASKFGLHAGIDLAHSPGTTALYFVVGNAWFRP
jgi:Omp85 superfamily domain